jgi:hypothetical protein
MAIHQFPKPDLSSYEVRQIVVPKNKAQLERALVPWISDVVRRLKQPHSPRYTPRFLVDAAPGKEAILEAPPGLSDRRGNVQKVRAKFNLIDGNHDGTWYLRSVEFVPELSDAQRAILKDREDDDKSELRKELEDAANEENRLHPKAQAFKAELHMDSWRSDIDDGAGVIQREMDTAHEYAKKAAAIPENFYTPKDMVKDTVMLGVGAAVGAAAKTSAAAREAKELSAKVPERLEQVYEGTEHFTEGVDTGMEAVKGFHEVDEAKEKKGVLDQSQYGVFHKTKADVVAEGVVSVLSVVPGGGTFVKMFAGMFMDIGNANFAGKVTKIRIRAYSWFVAGCVQGLTGVGIERPPKEPFDNIFFQLAYNRAVGMHEDAKFQAQIFLLAYSSGHHLLGTTNPGESIEHPDEWRFPDGFLAHWSPERLGRALATLLRTYDYLVN